MVLLCTSVRHVKRWIWRQLECHTFMLTMTVSGLTSNYRARVLSRITCYGLEGRISLNVIVHRRIQRTRRGGGLRRVRFGLLGGKKVHARRDAPR